MSNSLISYNFHDSNIRVVKTEEGNYLFCLADICTTLNLSTPAKTANQIKEEFGWGELNSCHLKDSLGRDQEFTMITEPQLYFVMMRSRAKVAREFRQWICNEVLPSIRQTGTYSEKKAISKSSWYVREIAEQFIKYGVADNDLFESVIDVTNRAFKQGYAIAMSKAEQKEDNAEGLVLTDEQQKALEHILHYHKIFRPDLLKAYNKLSELKDQASKLLIALEDIPLASLYDAATEPDFSAQKLKNFFS